MVTDSDYDPYFAAVVSASGCVHLVIALSYLFHPNDPLLELILLFLICVCAESLSPTLRSGKTGDVNDMSVGNNEGAHTRTCTYTHTRTCTHALAPILQQPDDPMTLLGCGTLLTCNSWPQTPLGDVTGA
jgi:hypothetical protein